MRITGVARRQAGVVSLSQARAAGLSEDAVRGRLASGRWRRLHPRTYLTGGELTDDARAWAAVLWAEPDGVLSGPAAAWWHGLLPQPPIVLEITVPRERRLTSRSGVRVRRRDLPREDLLELRRLPVTDVPLTVLETAAAIGAAGPAFLDGALQRAVSYPTLCRAQHRNLGRYGSRGAGRLLADAGDRAASRAERLMIGLLRRAGLRGWTTQYAVAGYRLDVAFPAARLAIEVDGWAWHSDITRFRADRTRQNAVVLAGWTVLRFTWHDLTGRPEQVLAEITAALRAARAG